jgi:hypothetical protein
LCNLASTHDATDEDTQIIDLPPNFNGHELTIGGYYRKGTDTFLKVHLPYNPDPCYVLHGRNFTDHDIYETVVKSHRIITANLRATTQEDNKSLGIFNIPDPANVRTPAAHPGWFNHSQTRLMKILEFIEENKNAIILIQEVSPQYHTRMLGLLDEDYYIEYPEDDDINRGRTCIIIHNSLIEGKPTNGRAIRGKNKDGTNDNRLIAMSCDVVFKDSEQPVTLVSTHLPEHKIEDEHVEDACIKHNIDNLFRDIPIDRLIIIGGDMNYVYSKIGPHFVNNGAVQVKTDVLIPVDITREKTMSDIDNFQIIYVTLKENLENKIN